MTVAIAPAPLRTRPRAAPNLVAPRADVQAAARLMLPTTVDELMEMIAEGVVAEDATTELLYGVVVLKDRSDRGDEKEMGHGNRHRYSTRKLIKLAASVESSRRHMQIQLPVVCGPKNAPEPDAAIIRGTDDNYVDRLPTGADCLCAIEVADSSLLRDKRDKLPIYAAASIPQYVILNTADEQVEVYAGVDAAAGRYASPAVLRKGDTLSLNLGDGESLDVPVSDLLP